MNKIELHNMRLMKSSSISKNTKGYLKIRPQNKDPHEYAKLCLMLELMRNGSIVYSEAEFEGGGVGDVYDCSSGIIYEILSSETNAQLKEKIKKYPKELRVVAFRVGEDFKPPELKKEVII